MIRGVWAAARGLVRPKPPVPDLSMLRPADPVGRVVVSGLGPQGFAAGKCEPDFFFPPFVFELARSGIETVLAGTMRALLAACDTPLELAVIHVYNEDFHDFDELFGVERQVSHALVFNRAELGGILGWKDRTHALLAARGIAMPRRAEELHGGETVFSNARRGSGSPVSLVSGADRPDPSRYNVEFIDTRRSYRGTEYHITPRLMCVGREIVHSIIRCSAADSGNPSARVQVTPMDPELAQHLYSELIVKNRNELAALAAGIGDALGPGFYAHDLVVERDSGRVLVCESGFKFDSFEVRQYLKPMAARLPERELIFSPVQAARSAEAFLAECRRHGWFAGAVESPVPPGGHSRQTAAPSEG